MKYQLIIYVTVPDKFNLHHSDVEIRDMIEEVTEACLPIVTDSGITLEWGGPTARKIEG